ncbi:MAG: hypothetical protein AAGB93_22400 [Planctomycetota bacterium]
MVKDILSSGALTHFATIGLVLFVFVFLAITAWILSRTKREVDDWARIPLSGDDDDPIDSRDAPPKHGTSNGTT